MAEYIEYHPLKFWLDPASIAEIVAHIQKYLVDNPINSNEEIKTIIHDYLIAHPELIGVLSVNGETGEVILTADNINAGENTTIKDALEEIQNQIFDNYKNIENCINNALTPITILTYAPPIKSIERGFINNNGNLIDSASYKTLTYDIPNGAISVRADNIYVGGQSSDYLVFSAYDGDGNFIGGLNNKVINTGAGINKDTGKWYIPENTTSIKVTYGNRSTITTFNNFIVYGVFSFNAEKMVFNGVPSSSTKALQYYFNVSKDEIIENTFGLSASFVFPVDVIKYDYYLVTYDANSARTVLRYASNLTKGIDGNKVTINSNIWDTNKSIPDSATTVGVLINFTLSGLSEDNSKDGFKYNTSYICLSDYCLVNGNQVYSNSYPAGQINSYVAKSYNEGFNPMLGGRLCCIGDSLTAVYYKEESESWAYLIAKWNSMSLDNLGVSGCPMANDGSYSGVSMSERVDNLSVSKHYTHIFVMGGANDYNLSIPIGNNDDTTITTFKGAVNHIIDKLTEKYPTAKIVFATTYRRTASRADKQYADAMIEVCKLKSIPCLNNYEDSGVQMLNANWMSVFGADGTTSNKHLNACGDLFVAPRFEHALKYGV